MEQTLVLKWFVLAVCVLLTTFVHCEQNRKNLKVPFMIDNTKSYNNILRALRENWESPILYLKKRGYIPKGSEPAFIAKLSMRNAEAEDKTDEASNISDLDKKLHPREELQELHNIANSNKHLIHNSMYADASAGVSKPLHAPKTSSGSSPASASSLGRISTSSQSAIKVPSVAKIEVPQSILYTPSPKKGFVKNMKDKFFGLFGTKKGLVYDDGFPFERDTPKAALDKKYLNKEFDKNDDVYNTNADFLKDFDKELNKKLSKDRDYDKDVLNLNSKALASEQAFN